MGLLSEILKLTLPSLVLLTGVYFVIREFFRLETGRKPVNQATSGSSGLMVVKAGAYERFVLFLERISPESLLLRVNKQGFTSQELHTELLAAIRSEFEHNLAQQLYVSTQAWELIKNARSEITRLINLSAEKIKTDAPSIHLSTIILETVMGLDKLPTAEALAFLKEEFSRLQIKNR